MNMQTSLPRLAACLALSALLSACIVTPDQRHYAGGVVLVAPPAPREEIIGVAPVPGYIWLGGYWSWVGNRHEWVAGHWVAPRPGRVWVPHQWVRQGDGWYLKPGHWRRVPR
jgi:WXXGXW repeat (2 copies)